MRKQGRLRQLFTLGSLGLIAALSSQAYASGYKLEFQSTSVLADAGEAAVVEDAGTNWYNSAGLVYLPRQFVGSAIDVYNETTFTGSTVAPDIFLVGPPYMASGRATSNTNTILPALHYSLPLQDKYALGLSIVPAWGLLQDYGENSILRYDQTRVYTRTIDIAPSFAMKLNDQWSIGLGPDIHYWYLSSKLHVRTEPITATDSTSRISSNAWGYGGHIGILYRATDATRIGLNYRSQIFTGLRGYSQFVTTGISAFETNNFQLNVALPPTTTLSIYHDLNPTWAIMGTIAYDQWTVIRQLHGQNYMTPLGTTTDVSLKQGFSNTFDFSIGAHYKWNDDLMLRGSVKYEQTPTNDLYRAVNFPDGEKLGLNLGARYQWNKKVALDFIVAHVFTRTVPINITNVYGETTTGHTSADINLAGAQVVWNF